ncbi:MAG: AraC family transcriptional regulator [Psychromonas sp.]
MDDKGTSIYIISMNTLNTIANGINYFGKEGFPILLGRSITNPKPESPKSHPYDLTEVQHSHDFCELVVVTQGQGKQWIDGVEFSIMTGDVFLQQGGQRHFFFDRDNLEMANIMYDAERLKLPEKKLRCMPGYCAMFLLEPSYRKEHKFASKLHLNPIKVAHVQGICDEIEVECVTHPPGFEVILQAKLLELITYLSRAYVETTTTESQALLRVGMVISAMENKLTNNWKLNDLASIANMSTSNLLTVFRKATDETPIDYLMRLRIHHAMELLRQSDRTITSIAYDTGFRDSNYFTRQFKKIVGIPPRQFRRKYT